MNPRIITRGGLRAELWLGDCREVLPKLGKVDAVVTDPPYGIGEKMQGGTWGDKNKDMLVWDKEALPHFVEPLLPLAPIVSIWGGNYYALPPSRGWLSWFKPDAPPTMGHFELCWTNRDMVTRQICWSIAATNAEREGHPTQKPYRVMAWTMEQCGVTVPATVLDPYMGSGTTGIACLRSGRSFIGIEIDPRYYEIACHRIEQEARQGLLL